VDADDWEELRWWVAHEGIMVWADVQANRRTDWYLQVDTRCRFLGALNVCKVYDARPGPCRSYLPTECERAVPGGPAGEPEHDIELRTIEDVERYADAALRLGAIADRLKDPKAAQEPHRTARFTIDP